MTEHRALQRGLFRMQMDPTFAARVLARDPGATATLGLAADDLELLLELDPAAVAADAHGRRKDQMLGNLASEYGLTAVVGPDDLLAGFLASREMHAAIRADRPLPLAFGSYAARVAADRGDDALVALIALERAMVALRRAPEPAPACPPPAGADELHLSPRACLVRLRAGTLAWAAALRDALRMRLPHPTPDLGDGEETVLLLAAESAPHALPDVRPEVLEPPVALLLERARDGVGRGARASLAADLGAAPEDLEAFAESLVADGVLVRR
jgi:hypothetical protein